MTSKNSPLKKAVLLAAGKGTRMNKLTADLPKPMIPVAEVPILERILTGLISAGIDKFLIITGYKAKVIQAHFGDGSRWKISIIYQQQKIQNGTGRVVELARDFIGKDPFLLSYGDILVSSNTYASIQKEWTQKVTLDGIITIKLGEDIRQGAVALFDEKFNLCDLVEKPNESEIEKLRLQFGNFKPWYNAGIYVFKPCLFKYIAQLKKSSRGEYELTDAIRQMAQEHLCLHGLVISDYWIDVRDTETLAKAQHHFTNGESSRTM